jgi:hypothetical protein
VLNRAVLTLISVIRGWHYPPVGRRWEWRQFNAEQALRRFDEFRKSLAPD